MGRSSGHGRHRGVQALVALAALAFVHAASGAGELVVASPTRKGLQDMRMALSEVELSRGSLALLQYLKDVRTIEEWAEVELPLPPTVTGPEVRVVASIADIIRRGGRSVTWHHFTVTVREEALAKLKEGGVLRWEQPVGETILGTPVQLGYKRIDVVGYRVASTERAPGQADHVEVRLEPVSEEAAKGFEHLAKEPTLASPFTEKRRPPPPPRKQKRGGGASKKRKKHGRRR